jgi:hypothetical protein
MLKSVIRDLFNEKLAGEMFEYSEIVPYLDLVIDEINADLSATFPAFSEFTETGFPGYKEALYTTYDVQGNPVTVDNNKKAAVYQNYDLFPDKYIRSDQRRIPR